MWFLVWKKVSPLAYPRLSYRIFESGILRDDPLQVVEESRCSKQMLKALNNTFSVPIPKQDDSNSMDKFRPISRFGEPK
jgi:hypothetical protein